MSGEKTRRSGLENAPSTKVGQEVAKLATEVAGKSLMNQFLPPPAEIPMALPMGGMGCLQSPKKLGQLKAVAKNTFAKKREELESFKNSQNGVRHYLIGQYIDSKTKELVKDPENQGNLNSLWELMEQYQDFSSRELFYRENPTYLSSLVAMRDVIKNQLANHNKERQEAFRAFYVEFLIRTCPRGIDNCLKMLLNGIFISSKSREDHRDDPDFPGLITLGILTLADKGWLKVFGRTYRVNNRYARSVTAALEEIRNQVYDENSRLRKVELLKLKAMATPGYSLLDALQKKEGLAFVWVGRREVPRTDKDTGEKKSSSVPDGPAVIQVRRSQKGTHFVVPVASGQKIKMDKFVTESEALVKRTGVPLQVPFNSLLNSDTPPRLQHEEFEMEGILRGWWHVAKAGVKEELLKQRCYLKYESGLVKMAPSALLDISQDVEGVAAMRAIDRSVKIENGWHWNYPKFLLGRLNNNGARFYIALDKMLEWEQESKECSEDVRLCDELISELRKLPHSPETAVAIRDFEESESPVSGWKKFGWLAKHLTEIDANLTEATRPWDYVDGSEAEQLAKLTGSDANASAPVIEVDDQAADARAAETPTDQVSGNEESNVDEPEDAESAAAEAPSEDEKSSPVTEQSESNAQT